MTEGPARPGRTGWPLGLLGMLAIVAVVERSVDRRSHGDLGTMYSIEWNFTGHSIKRQAPRAKILCLGTSLTRLGVSPRVIEDRLGLPTYNLGMSGGQPFATYTVLRHALDAGARPEAIVVEFKWSAIAMDYKWNERVLPEMATLLDCAGFAAAARDASFFARLALVSKLPTYRCRAEIRENIMAAIRGREPTRNYERSIMVANATKNHGATHTPKGSYDGSIPEGDPFLFPKDWSCHPLAESYIHKALDLAHARGIPVFWLIPPVPPATQARRNEVGAEERYTQFVNRVTAAHPDVAVIDARFSEYAREAFFDTTHLNRDGAVALSADLADAMAARLSGPRASPYWVSLPKYRPNPGASKVEDLSESLAALSANDPYKRKR